MIFRRRRYGMDRSSVRVRSTTRTPMGRAAIVVAVVAAIATGKFQRVHGSDPFPVQSLANIKLGDFIDEFLRTPPKRLTHQEEHDVPGYELLYADACATGMFNGDEQWFAYRDMSTGEILYRNLARTVVQTDPPCVHFLTQFHIPMTVQPVSQEPVLEIFDDRVGNYVRVTHSDPLDIHAADTSPSTPVSDQLLEEVNQYDSSPHRPKGRTYALDSFEFSMECFSPVDVIDGMEELVEQVIVNDVLQVSLRTSAHFDSTELTLRGMGRRLAYVRKAELELLAAHPFHTRNEEPMSLADWMLVRNATTLQERKPISDQWMELAITTLVLNASTPIGIHCIRRALSWNPSHVEAYLQLSSILLHNDHHNTSCQLMEMMLENADPTTFRPSEMRTLLTTNFPHCSIIIRVANLWENSVVVRWIVGASVVISLLHGVFVVGYFLNAKCCSFRKARSGTCEELTETVTNQGAMASHARKGKRS